MKNYLPALVRASVLLMLGFAASLRAEDYSVTSFAGSASSAGGVDGTPGTFNSPSGIAIDAAKNLYVTDTVGHTIRKISPGRVVSTLAGSAGVSGSADGTGSTARFNSPIGIAVDGSGNVYVAEVTNSTIRKITPAGAVTTFAGAAFQFGATDGAGTSARFFLPYGLAIDSSGNLYVADGGNNTIRKITAGGTVSTLAGAPQQSGFIDGAGSAARFNNPWGVTVDTAGNVYVADYGNNAIRKVTPAGVVTTVAGVSGVSGFQDGSTAVARFSQPRSVSVNSNGDLFVSDYGNSVLRRITGSTVTKVAGAEGVVGAIDSVGASVRFYNPTGIVADGNTVYVADTGNNLIRRAVPASTAALPSIAAQPLAQIINAGQSVSFGVVASGSGLTYQWLKNSVSISGATTPTYALSAVTANDEAVYSVRISGTDGTVDSAQASLTVVAAGVGPITSRPLSQAITVGQSATFSVVASGSSPTYQWSKNGSAISGATSANYSIASVQPGDAGAYTVAVNAGSASETASATLVVLPVGSNSITIVAQPASRNVSVGQSVTFSVTATGTNLTYQWQKNGSNLAGATSASYTIPSAQSSDAGNYTVIVTSGGTTQPSAPAVLTVGSSSITIATQPASQSVTAGQGVMFTVAATGSSLSYQWQKDGANISGATSASYNIASAQTSDAASYTVVVTSGSTNVTSSAAVLTVTAVVNTAPAAHLINLSILTSLASAGDAFTLGYVVGNSSAGNPKPLVIRAAGPSLGALGVGGTLADPKLELFAGPTKTGENDNWGGSTTLSNAFASVGAFPYSSAGSLDAAALGNITTRDNSVKVSAANTGTGVVIAEVYDATPSGDFTATGPRLINVSVLKNLGDGFTIGFVLRGTGSKSVVVRAVGPGLAAVGVTSGFVADPKLTLFGTGSSVLAANDDWAGTTQLSSAFTAVGAFAIPTTSKDAAVLANLPSGDYTVQVAGNGSTAGLVLVEVYEVP